uniref:Uncharacterized protein n=1 Tax=Setaria digitata TaxID=48799 RepID=A0A915PHF6_9BILA
MALILFVAAFARNWKRIRSEKKKKKEEKILTKNNKVDYCPKDGSLNGSSKSEVTASSSLSNDKRYESISKLNAEDLSSILGLMAYGSLKNDIDKNLERKYRKGQPRQCGGHSVTNFDISSTYTDNISDNRKKSQTMPKNQDYTIDSSIISNKEIESVSKDSTSESAKSDNSSSSFTDTLLSDITDPEGSEKSENRQCNKNRQMNDTVINLDKLKDQLISNLSTLNSSAKSTCKIHDETVKEVATNGQYEYANSIHSSDFEIPSYLNSIPAPSFSFESKPTIHLKSTEGVKHWMVPESERTNSTQIFDENELEPIQTSVPLVSQRFETAERYVADFKLFSPYQQNHYYIGGDPSTDSQKSIKLHPIMEVRSTDPALSISNQSNEVHNSRNLRNKLRQSETEETQEEQDGSSDEEELRVKMNIALMGKRSKSFNEYAQIQHHQMRHTLNPSESQSSSVSTTTYESTRDENYP